MCYSAAIRADFAAFQRLYPNARISLEAFHELYHRRRHVPKPLLRTPKAMDAMFARQAADQAADQTADIRALIDDFNADQVMAIEQGLFEQRKRFADAERTLLTKTTKKAQEDRRIAGAKVATALARLESIHRAEPRESDTRIFPGWYAPVLILEDGEPVIRPMRYLCRPAGAPPNYDQRFPGAYNARRDNLRSSFWRHQFGKCHGVVAVTAFYEHVVRHIAEHRELAPGEKPEDLVLEFRPRPQQDMLVACLYSHWTPPPGSDEPALWSFAAVTDEPLPEVAAAGHDRTIVALQPGNVGAWLQPQGQSFDQLDALLEDKQRPYYEHRMAA